ncbi:hypothetical protein [Allobaculum sp. Allo2]|uniref:hypothetical protein n=1 Tax=Allobaculum sp. Allo2 TaxID=2853432 RepID=UPI001F60D596|nr:hypothetical protein [Allobaculum sp. Allo2]UNT93735.1 hypothetical protein KWG61_03080 [Allobaculum sp. Allo2]
MTAFTLLVSCLVLLLIPLIVLCVYGYTHETAWRPMVYGALYQVLYLILFRLIMPMLFASQSWFIELTKSPAAVAMLYTVLQAVYLCAVFLLYDRHLLKKGGPQSFALLFGLTYGVMEGAIFSGFDSLNALMSAQSVIDAVNVSAVWLHLGEALCMIVLYAWLAWAFYIQLQAKRRCCGSDFAPPFSSSCFSPMAGRPSLDGTTRSVFCFCLSPLCFAAVPSIQRIKLPVKTAAQILSQTLQASESQKHSCFPDLQAASARGCGFFRVVFSVLFVYSKKRLCLSPDRFGRIWTKPLSCFYRVFLVFCFSL